MSGSRNTLLTSLQDRIISELISEQKAESPAIYARQKLALERVFAAAKEKAILSVAFIKELNQLVNLSQEDTRFIAPEHRPPQPGTFRNIIVGTNPAKLPGRDLKFSSDGIEEILSILDEEKEFEAYKGTWFAPLDPKTHNASMSDALRGDNLISKQGEQTRKHFVQTIFEDTQRRPYLILFPRFDKFSNDNIQNYMERKMTALVSQFNKVPLSTLDTADAIKEIVKFIKSCIRLHPFVDLNHRTFALCVLNFLLLNNEIGYAPLSHRRIFTPVGINETLAIMDPEMVLFPKKVKNLREAANPNEEKGSENTRTNSHLSENSIFSQQRVNPPSEEEKIQFNLFLQEYNKSWDSAVFKKADRMKEKLENKKITTIDQVIEYARQKPMSRTAKVLATMSFIDKATAFIIAYFESCHHAWFAKSTGMMSELDTPQKRLTMTLEVIEQHAEKKPGSRTDIVLAALNKPEKKNISRQGLQ